MPLILFRPLRLILSSEQLRTSRIALLKATHFPFVLAIWLYERRWGEAAGASKLARHLSLGPLKSSKRPNLPTHRRPKMPVPTSTTGSRQPVAATGRTALASDHQRPTNLRPSKVRRRTSMTADTSTSDVVAELIETVKSLSVQVELLTATVADGQSSRK